MSATKDSDIKRFEESNQLYSIYPLRDGEYLQEIWFENAIAKPMPMGGMQPLSLFDLKIWCEASGIKLSYWDKRTIIQMSTAYVAGYAEYNNSSCLPPWGKDEDDIEDFDAHEIIAKQRAENRIAIFSNLAQR